MQVSSVPLTSANNMKIKKYFVPVILYVLLFAGLAVGAFYDYEISSSLTKMNDSWALFLEIWAEPPSLLFVAFSFAALAVYVAKQKVKGHIYLSSLCVIGGVIATYSTITRTVEYYSVEVYEMTLTKVLSALGALIVTALFVMIARRIKDETLKKIKPALVTVVAVGLATLVIISSIKSMWGRPRFRTLSDASEFVKWYIPVGRAADDAHKSFPSGHTSNAVIMYTLSFVFDALKDKRKANITRFSAIAWIALVMLSRMVCGAHFLSDTCAGAVITMTIVIVCHKLFYKEKT